MSDDASMKNMSREEVMSALFANMVMQNTNMALMFLGRMPHPETGQTMHDVEGAKFFIDQLEMLEFKTKGNLDKQEESFLKQSLTALRLAFVETVNKNPNPEPNQPAKSENQAVPPGNDSEPKAESAEEESKKRFTKKY
jgi:hypothetical protein